MSRKLFATFTGCAVCTITFAAFAVPECFRLTPDGTYCGVDSCDPLLQLECCGVYYHKWCKFKQPIQECDLAVTTGGSSCTEDVANQVCQTIQNYKCDGCNVIADGPEQQIFPCCPSADLGGINCEVEPEG